jgi:DNA polymerase I
MEPVLINGTGTDNVVLWYFSNNRIRKKIFRNPTWIFVEGDNYDLDWLERDLEETKFHFERIAGKTIFGKIEGLRIFSMPSRVGLLRQAVESVGLNRKFRIYNADLNPVLRYVSQRNLQFFRLDEYTDMDVEIPSVKIIPKVVAGKPVSVMLDDRTYCRIDRSFYVDAAQAIKESTIIVYDNTMNSFTGILERIIDLGYDLPIHVSPGSTFQSYGRIHHKNTSVQIYGKMCINADSFIYSEAGLDGLFQVSRISSLPLETASSVTPGTAVSALEMSRAVRSGYLVTAYKDDHEGEKSPEELISTDRGGLVLDPDPGLYDDVYEIDFSSMYPSIIVRYNLSPETVMRSGTMHIPETPYFVSTEKRGFLSTALEELLEIRLRYKAIKKLDPLYANRDIALKWLLLTSFGYTGYKNAKFGKIEVHEAITALGRWILSTAIRLAREMGFTVIHGIVDSLWISGSGDISFLIEKIKQVTRIDIVVDGHYRWIAFLPSRKGIGSPNSYIGLRVDGTYKLRGISARRSDVPTVVKKMQVECLEILKDCMSSKDIAARSRDLYAIRARYMAEIRSYPREDLLVKYRITRHPEEYVSGTMQREIAMSLHRRGMEVNPGESIEVLVTAEERHAADIDGDGLADRKFYGKLIERAFECFQYMLSESAKISKNGKWLQLF